MKNFEKYENEVREYNGDNFCRDFVIPHILKKDNCAYLSCSDCGRRQMLWFVEEYEEPEIDWSKVKVDTPILVRDYEDTESAMVVWLKRYFAEYKDGLVYTWINGRTSWNEDCTKGWKYAKLAENEELK